MGFRIFIVYSQDDFFDSGFSIRDYLTKLFPDAHVFIDQIKPKGQKWRPENERELRASDLVILIITPASLQSKEVKKEISISFEIKKIILPCKDDNIDLDWNELPNDWDEFDGITFENEEKLKRRLFREIKKIRKEISEKTIVSEAKEPQAITVQTDKKSYVEGETIVVTGKVKELLSGFPISLQIIAPNWNLVTIEQLEVFSDKKFRVDLIAGGSLWESPGAYTVKVLYGSEARTSQVTFDFVGLGKTKQENVIKLPLHSSNPKFKKLAEPETLTIQVGDRVRWINDDTVAHTITSGNRSDGPDGVFDSSLFMSGNSFEVTFRKKGTYKYFCMVHTWKECTIIVR